MIELPYFAGFLDADGYVTILRGVERSGATKYTVGTGVSQNTIPVLECFAARFGGRVTRQSAATLPRPVYQWRVHGKQAEAFLRAVLPYLIVKREQVELAIEFRGLVGVGHRDAVSLANRREREDCWRRMAKLNGRGIRGTSRLPSAA